MPMVEEALQQKDIEQIILEVWDENIGAICVYDQAGFQLYMSKDNALEGYTDSILMLLSGEER